MSWPIWHWIAAWTRPVARLFSVAVAEGRWYRRVHLALSLAAGARATAVAGQAWLRPAPLAYLAAQPITFPAGDRAEPIALEAASTAAAHRALHGLLSP